MMCFAKYFNLRRLAYEDWKASDVRCHLPMLEKVGFGVHYQKRSSMKDRYYYSARQSLCKSMRRQKHVAPTMRIQSSERILTKFLR